MDTESYQYFALHGLGHTAPLKEKHNKVQPYHDETLHNNTYLNQLDPLPTHFLRQILRIADTSNLSYICQRKLAFASTDQSSSNIWILTPRSYALITIIRHKKRLVKIYSSLQGKQLRADEDKSHRLLINETTQPSFKIFSQYFCVYLFSLQFKVKTKNIQ